MRTFTIVQGRNTTKDLPLKILLQLVDTDEAEINQLVDLPPGGEMKFNGLMTATGEEDIEITVTRTDIDTPLFADPIIVDISKGQIYKHAIDFGDQGDIEDFNEDNKSRAIYPDRFGFYSVRDVLAAWLVWNGIIGYTDRILNLLSCVTLHPDSDAVLTSTKAFDHG